MEVIEALLRCGVRPALGHIDVTYKESARGFEAGIRHVTHLFNAMRGFHHRDPGSVVAALERPEVSLEIVCDGVHLHPATVKIAVKAAGMPDGVLRLQRQEDLCQGREMPN